MTDVEVVELGVDADEQELGITSMIAVSWEQMTIVALKTSCGLRVCGSASPREGQRNHADLTRGFARARAKATLANVRLARRERESAPFQQKTFARR
jgi:hypothetical protein